MWGKDIRAKTYKTGGQVLMIPVEEIRPNPDQPRREFDQGKLLELAQSIGENGMIHPLTDRDDVERAAGAGRGGEAAAGGKNCRDPYGALPGNRGPAHGGGAFGAGGEPAARGHELF